MTILAADTGVKIGPARMLPFDQVYLPISFPLFDLLLSTDRASAVAYASNQTK